MVKLRWPQFLMVKGNPDKKPPTGKRPRKIKRLDAIALIGLVVLVILLIWTLVTDSEQIQPQSVVVIPKPGNPERSFDVDMNLFSSTFGAGSNITIYVTVHPDKQSLKEFIDGGQKFTADHSGKGLPSKYFMLFEGSFCGSIPKTHEEKYERTYSCALPLEFWGQYYRNYTSIVYPVEGEYGVWLDEALPDRTPQNATSIDIIKIAPLEARLNYLNAKYIGIATWVTIYVASVSVYLQIRKNWINPSS